jgi:5-oxopent-3-ene-1,2,5-tricarboxylate decarboxylase/2-hydroxyhepta-2,4-diene-1,7-dioate isomerase
VRLARVRRVPSAEPELVAQHPAENGRLVSLRDIYRADPVGALDELGILGLAVEIDRVASDGSPSLSPTEVTFEVPVERCSKVCCLALNYRDHAAESGLDVPPDPVLFFKPPSALIAHGAFVCPPSRTRHVEHEVELAAVIGQRCRDVSEADWRSVVAGLTIINDVTARDLQLASVRRGEPWDQSKAFDTFAPLGPYLVTLDEIPDPQALHMTLTVRGEVRQKAFTGDMVHTLGKVIATLSDGMTLMPGDIIATGTTAGIAPVQDGDVMEASIDRLGTLVSPVSWERG